jgi:hypothetical protein
MVIDLDRERSSAAFVALHGNATPPAVRRVSPPSPRCRPGEAPRWVRLDLDPSQAAALRDASNTAGVPIDAWIAITLEFAIALRLVVERGSPLDVVRADIADRVDAYPVQIARDPEWRTWQACIAGHAGFSSDELPEVVLPARLLARTGGSIDLPFVLEHTSDWPMARVCELAACAHGQTLEAFMFQVALLDVVRPRAVD